MRAYPPGKITRSRVVQNGGYGATSGPDTVAVIISDTGSDGGTPMRVRVWLISGDPEFDMLWGTPSRPWPLILPADILRFQVPQERSVIFSEVVSHESGTR